MIHRKCFELAICQSVYDQRNPKGIPNLHSRHIPRVRDSVNLPLFNALLVLFTRDLFVLTGNRNQSNFLILIALKVAVGGILELTRTLEQPPGPASGTGEWKLTPPSPSSVCRSRFLIPERLAPYVWGYKATEGGYLPRHILVLLPSSSPDKMILFPVFSTTLFCLWALLLSSGPIYTPIFTIPALISPVLAPTLSAPLDGSHILIFGEVCVRTVTITFPTCDPTDTPVPTPSPPGTLPIYYRLLGR